MRVFEGCAPFYSYIAMGAQHSRLFKAWHPIDDENCFTFYIHFDPERRIDRKRSIELGAPHVAPDYKTAHNNGNMHLQDRRVMSAAHFSGIDRCRDPGPRGAGKDGAGVRP